jgi:hypothetical protein
LVKPSSVLIYLRKVEAKRIKYLVNYVNLVLSYIGAEAKKIKYHVMYGNAFGFNLVIRSDLIREGTRIKVTIR